MSGDIKRYPRMRGKRVDSTHIFILFASDFQCYTEVTSVVPQDISITATHRDIASYLHSFKNIMLNVTCFVYMIFNNIYM